ncbi:hypothetical protein HUF15_39370 [Streptomyces samsunensis]|uniref:hypothetical protein n=1 Tax=Streptomyces malaysiensis TaxID=92644 RepID=UPI00158350F0|nr:hypothetical protein [Streptomyces samsunensis]NUH42700.1 hypothetical protein [Streptomyces samsunensis]
MEVAYRFAGFEESPRSCAEALDGAGRDVERLHLVADPRPAPTTMRLETSGV